MATYERRISEPKSCPVGAPRRARFDLAGVDLRRISRKFVVFTPVEEEIISLVEAARREMGGGADPALVCQVARHNPDSFWAIARKNCSGGSRTATGHLAFLMLNAEGMRRLISGALDTTRPELDLIVSQNEKPAGIYVWGAYTQGLAAGGVPLAFEKVSSRLYGDVDLYSRAITAGGREMLESFGFRRGAEFEGKKTSKLYSYRRGGSDTRSNPIYDTYREETAGSDDVSLTVVHTIEEMMRVIAIRGAVYISEQDCPYLEEFEGNDFSGSHLLAYVGDEPAGCLRIRYFADFAKLERLAVLPRFRGKGIGTRLMLAGVEFCRMKGYQTIYGRAQKGLLKYYVKMGFRAIESIRPIRFSGYDYTAFVFDAARDPHAVTLNIDPYILLRLEGRWHEPGPFDPAPGEESEARDQEFAA